MRFLWGLVPVCFAAFLTVAFTGVFTGALSAQELPAYRSIYLNDYTGTVSPDTEAQLSAMLAAARANRDHEMTVVVINRRADYGTYRDIAAFSTALFNSWGVGNAERNDGLMLVVALQDRDIQIALGAGYRARFDGVAKRIIDSIIVPDLRAGQLERGLLRGTKASLERLRLVPAPVVTEPVVAEPVIAEPVEAPEAAPEAGPAVVPSDTAQAPPVAEVGPGVDQRPGLLFRIRDALIEGALDNPVMAALTGLIGALASFFGIRWGARNRPRKCPECGRVMLRLGTSQEDQYLDHGQLVEEKINSKDYGVWFCTHDEHVTIIGYPVMFTRHQACPACSYHTYETRREVLKAATTARAGSAKLHHSCRNCDHADTSTVTIPRIRTQSASSRSGSGGSSRRSSSRSSFSGGRSSGGGASGKW